jgi:hypothetical protein
MKKIGNTYSRTFDVENILLAKYENGIIKSECWNISIELQSEDVYAVAIASVRGLSIDEWLRSLFGQKFLATEETEYTAHFTNVLYVNSFESSYIIQLIEMILKPNLSESVIIKSVEINVV